MNIIKVKDQLDLVSTEKYKYAKFPFSEFNPVQSRVFEFYDKDCNAIIAAKTSAGKTVVSEMFAAERLANKKGKIIYLAPMRALAKEKYDDWTHSSHHFSKYKISVCTGDYRLTPDRKKEIDNSDIIILTSEMLNSRTRNFKSENNEWLKKVSICIVDEAHLLTVPSRGDHLEVGLINFSELNPDVKFVLLSATMPNVDEIAGWISNLNSSESYLLESEYRPCPLGIHYEKYDDLGFYKQIEENKIQLAIDIIKENIDDKFLLFVHTKETGRMLESSMKEVGLDSVEFHSADLDKNKRERLENKFKDKSDKGLKYLIATSTLAWGCNTPARRVIVLGVHRAFTEVENYDIFQMIGRSGRPGFDLRGDAYILLPRNKFTYHKNKLSIPARIESKLLENSNGNYKTLAFHLVSEIHHGRIKNKDDVKDWYGKTLAHYQLGKLDGQIINSALDLLLKCRAIELTENKEYKITIIGMIASMFYYSPFDVADLRANFKQLFFNNNKGNDLLVAMAFGNTDTNRFLIANKNEKNDMEFFKTQVGKFTNFNYTDGAYKAGFAYYCAMQGKNIPSFASTVRLLQNDFPRIIQVLNGLDSMGCKWKEGAFFKEIQSKVIYGVGSNLIDFVQLPGIGKVKAERLWSLGFKDLNDIIAKPEVVSAALNMKADKVKEVVNQAKQIMLLKQN